LLIGAEGRARLAPLYDIASILPYDFDIRQVRLAMKVGGNYRLRDVGPRQWRKVAADLRLDADALVQRVRDMAAMLPDHLSAIRQTAEKEGLDHPLIELLSDALSDRARHCIDVIDMSAGG
jgi:serine/threonine-protein kinase HipA